MSKDTVFNDLVEIHAKLCNLEVSPSLVWVLAFDILKDTYEEYQTIKKYNDVVVREGVTIKDVFDKFYDDADTLRIHMDMGIEIINELLFEWMLENNFLVALDEDGWLE